MKFNHIESVGDSQERKELSSQQYTKTLFEDLEHESFQSTSEEQHSEGKNTLDNVFNYDTDEKNIPNVDQQHYQESQEQADNINNYYAMTDMGMSANSLPVEHHEEVPYAMDGMQIPPQQDHEYALQDVSIPTPMGLGLESFEAPVKKQNKKIIGSGSISVNPTRICVMGVGGGGVNATNMMVTQKIRDVDIVAANTDGQTLNTCLADNVLPLGHNLGGGLGAGGNPLKGAEAAKEARKDIYDWVKQYDMLFLAAGLGGGTGTGATPIIAEIAKEAGVLTVGVVTLPFSYEGSQRISIAEYGLRELESVIDSLLVIPNDNILQNDFTSHEVGVEEGFKIVDNVLANTVRSITEIITIPSLINIDFADIRNCLSGAGRIAVGFGYASSEERKSGNAHRAVESALKNTVISQENIEIIKGANHIIANTIAGPEVSINDYTAISDMIASRVNAGGNHSFKHGYRVEPTWGKKVQVTIIASDKVESDEVSRLEKSGLFHTRYQHSDYRKLPQHEHVMEKERSVGVESHLGQYAKASHDVHGEREKEVLRVDSDYVKNDVFEQLLERNNFESQEDVLEQELESDRYSSPAVNRLLGLSNEHMVDTRAVMNSALSNLATQGTTS